jgi:hypothetical protein
MQKKELFAIAKAITNYINKHKIKTARGLPKNYSYAKENNVTAYSDIKTDSAKTKNGNKRKKMAISAGINALLVNGVDYSNGATCWDGIDVLQNSEHYRYRAHNYYHYIKGIYDPKGLSKSFYDNALQYGTQKNLIKPLNVVDNKVMWELAIESEKSVLEGQKNGKNKYFEIIGEENKIVPKELYKVIYKGPGHNLWFYPKTISLYDVVAQEGLSIFYTITEKIDPNEILQY